MLIIEGKADTELGVALRGGPGWFLACVCPWCRVSGSNHLLLSLWQRSHYKCKEISRDECLSSLPADRQTDRQARGVDAAGGSVAPTEIMNNYFAFVLQNLRFLAIGYSVTQTALPVCIVVKVMPVRSESLGSIKTKCRKLDLEEVWLTSTM